MRKENAYTLSEIAQKYELPVTCLKVKADDSSFTTKLGTVELYEDMGSYGLVWFRLIDGTSCWGHSMPSWIPIGGKKRCKKR